MDEDYSNGNTFLDYLKFGGTTATGVLNALKKPQTPAKTPATNWGIIAGIGAAVLVVLVLVVALGRK